MECNVLLLFQIIPLWSPAVEVSVFRAGHLRRCVIGQLAGPKGDKREREKNPESPKLRRPHRAAAAAAAIGQVGLQRPRRARRERALIQPLGPARGLCTIFWCLYVSFILLVVGRGYILCTLEAFQSTSASNIFGTPGWWCWSGLVGSPHKCPQIKHRRDCGEPQCCQV